MSWDALRSDLENELGEAITLDALTGSWRLAQRANGHRHSVDDVLTASYALDQVFGAAPTTIRPTPPIEQPSSPINALDLGSGIGGVGLLVLWGLPVDARLVCVEAQAVSYRLLTANLVGNQLTDRASARLGDLRQLALAEKFALITGSPPYFPIGTGILPADSQKAHARFELRGDVGDYAACAVRHLTPDGVFVCCFPSAQLIRAKTRITGAGLHVVSVREVVPRAGLRPLFSLLACRLTPATCREDAPLVVRDADGAVTEEMLAVRRRFGFAAG